MKIAVIGLGGIGKRHVGNFRALGCDVRAWDIDPARTEVTDLDAALDGADGVVIATPPDSHLRMARCAMSHGGAYVMIEKPLSANTDDVVATMQIAAADKHNVLVAYPWRHWPPLQYVKRLLDEGRIGRVLSAHTEYGYHLERHGPHANRPDSYMRSLARGGGCLLDTSHAIDYMRWLLGEITEVSGVVETRALKMDADDCANLTVRFASGAVGGLHLSLFLPDVTSRLEIMGERGRILWDRAEGAVMDARGEWLSHRSSPNDINEMYLAEAAHFLACVRGEATPVCDGWDGLQTLRVVDAARRASAEKRWVTV